jgi:hypothetical protein
MDGRLREGFNRRLSKGSMAIPIKVTRENIMSMLNGEILKFTLPVY